MKNICALAMMVILSGCAAMGPTFQPAPAPSTDKALVYIYRVDGFALGGRDAYFYVDDVNIADLSRRGYTWFHAPAGRYVLKQKWPIDVSFKTLEVPVTWEAGSTYYYRFTAYGGSNPAPGTISIGYELSQPSQAQASGEIRQTNYQEASGAAKLLEKGKK